MILKKLKLHNFRGYKDIEIEFDEQMNVIVGRNDVGKSTILEALEIFFNPDSKQVKLEEQDLYVRREDDEIKISCSFLLEDREILIDTSVRTGLKEEYLYNSEKLLEIVQISNKGKKIVNYINANYPQKYLKTPLVQLKIADLKKELEKYRDEIENYSEINKSISSQIRQGIYRAIEKKNDFELQEVLIDISKEEMRNIYPLIQKQLPIYFLFKSDRENRDGDSEVQNPLKVATKEVLKGIETKLEEIKRNIEEEVEKIGKETIEKLKELDKDIAQNLTTSVNTKTWDSLFSFQLIDDTNIPLNKRGSGVRRLLLLSYLRAEAERRAVKNANSNIIYAIEEPETAQHPNFQKMIMESLISLSKSEMHQIILTTHTPEIAKMVKLEQIIFIKKGKTEPIIEKDEKIKFKEIKETLGMHNTLESKVVLCVEGPNDVNFIKNIGKIKELKAIVDFENNKEISILPLRGGNLKEWVENDYLKNSNVKEVHLYDSDVEDYKVKVDEMNKNLDNKNRRKGIITKRYEMENYVPIQLIEEEFEIELDTEKNWEKEDIPKLLLNKVKKNIPIENRQKVIKEIINGKISKKITKEMLEKEGTYEEIKSWFQIVAEFL